MLILPAQLREPAAGVAHAVESLRQVLELQRRRLRGEPVPRSLRRLLEMPPGRARVVLGNSSPLRARHPAGELLRQAHHLRFAAPCASLGAAWLAAVGAGGGSEPARFDLQARALGLAANAARILGHGGDALRALEAATACREQGTGDPLLALALRRYRAALHCDSGNHAAALRLLRGCAAGYSRLGEGHLVAYTLLAASRAVSTVEGPEPAIVYTWWALKHLDPRRERALVATALHNLAWFYTRQRRHDLASQTLAQLLGLDTGGIGEWFGLSVRWLDLELRGKLAQGENLHLLWEGFQRLRRPRHLLGLRQALWEVMHEATAESQARARRECTELGAALAAHLRGRLRRGAAR